MSQIALDVSLRGNLPLKQQLKLLTMDKQTQRLVMRKCAFEVRKASRKNIRQQKDYRGKPFEARKKDRADGKKMLQGVSRFMSAYATNREGVVTWRNPVLGRIAKYHQEGISETFDMERFAKSGKGKNSDDLATMTQAIALKEAGYKRMSGGKRVPATIKWIQENVSVGQAGYILRVLRGQSQKNWKIPLPARPFLGVDEAEINTIVNQVFDTVTTKAGIA